MPGLILITVIIILLSINGRRLYLEDRKKARLFIHNGFGKHSSKKISEKRNSALSDNLRFYLDGKKAGEYVDDLTWSDTGMEDIFLQIDKCYSSFGEEYLYRRLHDLSLSENDINDADKIISDLTENEKYREELSLSLYYLGFEGEGSLPGYIEKIENTEHILNPAFHIICDLLYILAGVLTAFSPIIGAVFFIVIILLQISSYFSFRKKADECLAGFSIVRRLTSLRGTLPVKVGDDSSVSGLVSELKIDLDKINSRTAFSAFITGSGSNSSAGIFSMFFTYLNLLFHFDLIAAEFLLRKIGSQKEHIISCYEKTGFLDMCLVLSSYREFLNAKNGWCRPEFTSAKEIFIEKGYNPLLDKPVSNDANTKGGVLITGSNASGKSTYMRMIAVNAILARTVSTCAASIYRAGMFSVFSSIAVNDSIIKGESYFMAEINSLKRIVDAAESSEKPVICFIDEIFKGTNTSERIAASRAVLKYLRDKNVIVFAATHDLELTSLVSDMYENVHFSEVIEGNDVSFTYRLEQGPSKSRNAIALLRMKGFPENVIRESEKLCLSLDDKGV